MNYNFIDTIKTKSFQIFLMLFILTSSAVFSQQQKRLISNYMRSTQIGNFKKADLTDFDIDNVDPSESLKGNIVKIQQKFKGYPVYNAVGTAVIKSGQVIYFSDSFVKNYHFSASNIPTLTQEKALERIAVTLDNDDISNFLIVGNFK